jgi:2-methylisocitrate lyase-like PEP mutase family enzyme
MNRDTQRAKAEAFRAMHDRSRILVLPNAWDAMSARVIEEAGARAIATTSAGVAFSVGYPDGEAMPRDEMIAAIARIARVVTIPVSADIESGFAHDAREVAETVRRVIDAGAVGINLEDQVHDGTHSLYDLEVAVQRVRAAREAATPPACRSSSTRAPTCICSESASLPRALSMPFAAPTHTAKPAPIACSSRRFRDAPTSSEFCRRSTARSI